MLFRSKRCSFAERCSFAMGCSLAEGSSFAKWCSFAEWCFFAERCSFADGCSFDDGCSLEAGKKMVGNSIYSCGGMGSEGRTTYGIPTKEGVFVRCGCWFGNLSEFRDRAKEVYGDSEISVEYGIVADLFEARWKREVGR